MRSLPDTSVHSQYVESNRRPLDLGAVTNCSATALTFEVQVTTINALGYLQTG